MGKGKTKGKTLYVSEEVYRELMKLKEKLQVNSMDLVLRWLLKMPPFVNIDLQK